MNQINEHNYKAFLLDYLEGNLNAQQVSELLVYAEDHPEIKEDMEAFGIEKIQPVQPEFEGKNDLKQIALENLMIGEIEEINSFEESLDLKELLITSPTHKADFELYQKTILEPSVVVFADKDALKRKNTKVIPMYWWAGSAAAVALLFILLRGFDSPTDYLNNPTVAEQVKVEKTLPSQLEENKLELLEEDASSTTLAKIIVPDLTGASTQQNNVTNQILSNDSAKVEPNAIEESLFANATDNEVEKTQTNSNEFDEEQQEMVDEAPEFIHYKASFLASSKQGSNTEEKEILTIAEHFKKFLKIKGYDTSTKKVDELKAVGLLAKLFGNKGSLEEEVNDDGVTTAYALNLAWLSISKKIRKKNS
ncbi:MAG: hypothetical protein HRT71_07775 [Flavobacteriales bacterium]|nr:hypothetical protein [Flavobacteriales bacterium]